MRRESDLNDLDLPSLRAFVTICEMGSVTEAARHLGVTQSAISQRLKKLEKKSRHELLDRSLRPIRTTYAGQAFLERARKIIAEVTRLEFDLAGDNDFPLDELRLGIVDSLAPTLVPPLVQTLRETVNRVAVRVDGSVDLVKMLIDRNLDIIISSDPIQERDCFERHEVYREHLLLAMPRDLPIAMDDPAKILHQLANMLPMVRYTSGTLLSKKIDVLLRRLSLSPLPNLEFNDSASILGMVCAKMGWAITTPICLFQSRAPLNQLSLVALPFGEVTHTFYLINRRDELGALPGRLVKMIEEIIGKNMEDFVLEINQ